MLTLTLVLFSIGVLSAQLIPNGSFKNVAQSPSTEQLNASLPLRIEVLLLRFDNPLGIVYSGNKCDFFSWGCDIQAFGYIDLKKPYEEWPGQREIAASDNFWYRGEESSPRFNKNFAATVCNPNSFTAGSLRVHLMDVDGGLRGADDFINNFNCIFTKPSLISSEERTQWSNELACDAVYSQPMMGMYFKYRVYRQTSFTGCPTPKR